MDEQKSSMGKLAESSISRFNSPPPRKFRWTIEFVKTDGTVVLKQTFIKIKDRPGIEGFNEKTLSFTIYEPAEEILPLYEYMAAAHDKLLKESVKLNDLNGKLCLYNGVGSIIETWDISECRFISVSFGGWDDLDVGIDLEYTTVDYNRFTEN